MKNERDNNKLTGLLYETDGLMKEFEAVVIGSGREDEKDYVVLDVTAFFPEGGGQQADTGVIVTGSGERIRVGDVRIVSGEVRHYTEKAIETGSKITGVIDADQRFARMQIHGAEHIISGLINRTYGFDNVGFHMTDKEAVFDLSGPLSEEQINEIEERANTVVFKNVPIRITFPTPVEAQDMQYRSKLEITDNVRLVTIEDVDTCACCAPHLSSTGQIGIIKILDFMPHRKGTRITMTAGVSAYRDYAALCGSNSRIMEILSAKRLETAGFVNDLSERYMALKEENSELRKEMTRIVTKSVINEITKKDANEKGARLVFANSLDPTGLRNLVNECTKVCDGIICAFTENGENGYRYIFAVRPEYAESAGLGELTEGFNSLCKGRGGGSKLMTQGTSTATREEIERYLCG